MQKKKQKTIVPQKVKEEVVEKREKGRPTKYTPELADRICKAVSKSPFGLERICRENEGFPHVDTIREWRWEYNDFSANYAKAKLMQADILTEYCLEISDDSSNDEIENKHGDLVFNSEYVARARLKVDTRKWLASKLLPKQYGDRLVLEQKTEENDALKKELMELRAKLDKKNEKEY